MKKKLLCAALGLSISSLVGTVSFASDGPYVGGMIGTAFLDDSTLSDSIDSVDLEFDAGLNLSLMAGYKIGDARVEGEIGYQKNDADQFSGGGLGPFKVDAGGDVDLWRFMVNGYYDFNTGTPWTPYLGVGLGVATVSINDLSALGQVIGSDDDTVFAYQFGGGIGYSIDDNATIVIDYRYFATADPSFHDDLDAEVGSHNISLGLRYSF